MRNPTYLNQVKNKKKMLRPNVKGFREEAIESIKQTMKESRDFFNQQRDFWSGQRRKLKASDRQMKSMGNRLKIGIAREISKLYRLHQNKTLNKNTYLSKLLHLLNHIYGVCSEFFGRDDFDKFVKHIWSDIASPVDKQDYLVKLLDGLRGLYQNDGILNYEQFKQFEQQFLSTISPTANRASQETP